MPEIKKMLMELDAELASMMVSGDNVMHVAQSRIMLKKIYDKLESPKEDEHGGQVN